MRPAKKTSLRRACVLAFFAASISISFAQNGALNGSVVNWANWTTNTVGNPGGSALGTINVESSVITVNYSGEVFNQTQTNGTGTDYYTPLATYTNSTIPNAPTNGMITFVGGSGAVDTIGFSQPVTNPVIAIVSLGSPGLVMGMAFNHSFAILSSGAGWWGGGAALTQSNNVLFGEESDGTIQFNGVFSSISWTASPADSYYTGLTVGVPNSPTPYITSVLGGNGIIFQGEPYSMTAVYEAELPATNQWQFGSTNLGVTNNTLTLANPQSGLYTFVVSNAFGSASSNVTLNVLPPSAENTFNPYATAVTNIEGLLGYWRFDPTYKWKSCVNGWTGTNEGAAQIGPAGSGWPLSLDHYNQAALLDGVSSFVATDLTGQIGNQGTMLAWVYLIAQPAAAGHIFSVINQSQGGNNYDIQIETDNLTRFYAGGGVAVYSTPLSLNQWHFLSGTLASNGLVSLYVDGALVATTSGGHSVTSNPASIGESQVFTGRFFQGRIDEAAYFNIPLTPSQIFGLYSLSTLPKLNIAQAGTNVVLTWTTNAPSYQLQSNAVINLSTGWNAVPSPYGVSGTNFSVTNPINPGNLFYRLSIP